MSSSLTAPAVMPLPKLPPAILFMIPAVRPFRKIFLGSPSFQCIFSEISPTARFASSPKSSAASCCSRILSLSKIFSKGFCALSVLRESPAKSCMGRRSISMAPDDTADFVTLDADPWIGIWVAGKRPLSPGFTLPPTWRDTPLSLTL